MKKSIKTTLSLLSAAAATFLALQATPAVAMKRAGAALEASAVLTDRVIVKYRSAAASEKPPAAVLARANAAGQAHGTKLGHVRQTAGGAHVFKLDRAMTQNELQALAAALSNGDADVEYVEPDLLMQPQLTPNDSYYSLQWHYFEPTAGLNLPAAWDKSTGAGVTVAVIDTGVRQHVDLAGNLLPGYDFITSTTVSNDGDARDADPSDPGDWAAAGQCYSGSPATNSGWHGTHVAGTIAALTNNGQGVAGVAFNAKVVPVRVLGRCGGYTSDIADGMIWAAGGTVSGAPANANPARVLNLSLGGSGACSFTTQNAINIARGKGAVVVVAAGNNNQDATGFNPANCAGVVVVGAVGRAGAKSSYSNYGAAVDLSAPGGDGSDGIASTLNAGTTTPGADNYVYYQGTSMATPHVAGVAALMLAVNPALTPDLIEARLKASVRPFPVACTVGCGTGILDADMAVDAAMVSAVTNVAEVESNNKLANAQKITAPLPVAISGTIGSNSDIDHYSVTVPAGGSVVATLTGNASADYNLYALSSAGTVLSSSVLTGTSVDSVTVSNTGTAAMTVVLQVKYASGLTGTAGTYSLALSPN